MHPYQKRNRLEKIASLHFDFILLIGYYHIFGFSSFKAQILITHYIGGMNKTHIRWKNK